MPHAAFSTNRKPPLKMLPEQKLLTRNRLFSVRSVGLSSMLLKTQNTLSLFCA